ncbi:hypothetical protein CCUS01_06847, partial [Colletotrichum cuscutae]
GYKTSLVDTNQRLNPTGFFGNSEYHRLSKVETLESRNISTDLSTVPHRVRFTKSPGVCVSLARAVPSWEWLVFQLGKNDPRSILARMRRSLDVDTAQTTRLRSMNFRTRPRSSNTRLSHDKMRLLCVLQPNSRRSTAARLYGDPSWTGACGGGHSASARAICGSSSRQ